MRCTAYENFHNPIPHLSWPNTSIPNPRVFQQLLIYSSTARGRQQLLQNDSYYCDPVVFECGSCSQYTFPKETQAIIQHVYTCLKYMS